VTICVLGDAHLDVIARVSGPLASDTDTPASTAVTVGGQAANVAAWVTALGGRSRLIAAAGTDMGAYLVTAELQRRGVEVVGPVLAGNAGVVISLSDGGTRRSMVTDRGVGPLLAAHAISPEWLTGCDWLHLPAYSLTEDPVRGAALAAAAAAAERAVPLSIDLSSTAAIRAFGVTEFRALLGQLRPAVVFGNAEEAGLVAGVLDERLVEKLGPDGVLIDGRRYPARPTEPVDSTGAGDAFAAGYLLGGIELGLTAAARAVAQMGAMP
jgi:sugar/nucleoside kinase (ribokinase family)